MPTNYRGLGVGPSIVKDSIELKDVDKSEAIDRFSDICDDAGGEPEEWGSPNISAVLCELPEEKSTLEMRVNDEEEAEKNGKFNIMMSQLDGPSNAKDSAIKGDNLSIISQEGASGVSERTWIYGINNETDERVGMVYPK